MEVKNVGLSVLGFESTVLEEFLVEEVRIIADQTKDRFSAENVLRLPE